MLDTRATDRSTDGGIGRKFSYSPLGRRPDVQALRATAVSLVVLQHTFGLPSGGFIGVDVFLVVSGYLITGLLLSELATTGAISLRRFYARRLRRILPAALLVLTTSVALGYAVWFQAQANQNFLDAVAAGVSVANYHFAATGADYLAGTELPPALQHYWSLSVEEQFYLLWPALIIVGVSSGRRFHWNLRRLAVLALCLTVIGGWLLATGLTWSRPQFAYFDTASRAWELAAGGLVAVISRGRAESGSSTKAALTIIGLLTIVTSALVLSSHSMFPGPFAALPVVGTAMVLLGRPGQRAGKVLSLAPVQRLGDISYSLYLWHMPLIIIPATLFGNLNLTMRFACLTLAVALSIATYRLVENPARKSSWLRTWENRDRPSSWTRPVLTTLCLTIALAAIAAGQFNSSRLGVLTSATFPSERETSDVTFSNQTEVQQAIGNGLTRRDYQGVTPSVNSIGPSQLSSAFDRVGGCSNSLGAKHLSTCSFGQGDKTILVIGDSVAMAWVPSVVAAAQHAKVVAVGVPSCSPWRVDHGTSLNLSDYADLCRSARSQLLEQVKNLEPDTVVVSSSVGSYAQMSSAVPEAAWAEGVRSTVSAYLQFTKHVVVLENPPLGGDVRFCMNRVTGPQNCESHLTEQQSRKSAAESSTAHALGARVTFVPVAQWFCSPARRCPAVIGPYLVRVDPTHITAAYGHALGPLLHAAVPAL